MAKLGKEREYPNRYLLDYCGYDITSKINTYGSFKFSNVHGHTHIHLNGPRTAIHGLLSIGRKQAGAQLRNDPNMKVGSETKEGRKGQPWTPTKPGKSGVSHNHRDKPQPVAGRCPRL